MDNKRKTALGRPDPWGFLNRFTAARIALGRAGGSVPSAPLLAFQWAHAQARDAVLRDLDVEAASNQLQSHGLPSLVLESAAADRNTYIQRPDLGRLLSAESKALLQQAQTSASGCDVVFVVADGLSALAVERHASELLRQLLPELTRNRWSMGPVCVVRQGRVAIGDEIGALLSARMVVVLIGERPGLSSPDSLGIYLTYDPQPGRSNAQRNCISNVRPEALDYAAAAHRLAYLMQVAFQGRISGVSLKEDAPLSIAQPVSGNSDVDRSREATVSAACTYASLSQPDDDPDRA
jgi:ethanolamine ammonia-lyase small subunit